MIAGLFALPVAVYAQTPCVGLNLEVPLPKATLVEWHSADVQSARFSGMWQQGLLDGVSYRIFPDQTATITDTPGKSSWRIEMICNLEKASCTQNTFGGVPETAFAVAKTIGACLAPKPVVAKAPDKPKEADPKAGPVAKQAAADKTEPKTQPKAASDAKPAAADKTKPKAQPKAASDAKPAAADKTKPKTQPKAAPDPKPVAQDKPKAAPDAVVKPAVKAADASGKNAISTENGAAAAGYGPVATAPQPTGNTRVAAPQPGNTLYAPTGSGTGQVAVPSAPAARLAPLQRTCALSSATDRGSPMRAVQRLLTELGYTPGPIDGVRGKRTVAALTEEIGADAARLDPTSVLITLVSKICSGNQK